ncbi:LCP family protein [Ectobacillus sp. JY-23]|uniref:LCP family glycopolymer transferase n=1 Tax=Ectobacillus sp. JY-23 TaxID=2933872 RepID=UPI001FF2DFED|nr:LCP family protein [Ectobacillus sp. JY-23]UOY91316.1 LCP family protein [Ectobacillus sp. JY-23]
MNISRENIKKSKKKTIARILLFTLFFVGLLGAGFAYKLYLDVAKATDKMHSSISRTKSEKREEELEFKEKDPFSVLLVGVDEREGQNSRTDSILVLTVNPQMKSTKLVSIPRDTRATIVGMNKKDKINHAYAYGGIEGSILTIENFLDIPIDYYIKVNMEGFRDIVDAVGGIDVNNKFAFELDGVYVPEGAVHLDGEQALQYARMRKEDPNGDFGRQKRQREVIQKILDKGASFSSLTKYDKVLKALEQNIKTNLTFKEMMDIQSHYKSAAFNVEQIEIPGEGKIMSDELWYYNVEEKDRKALSNKLLDHLHLNKSVANQQEINTAQKHTITNEKQQ